MSCWTHVIGSLYIETCTKRKNIKKYVEKMLKDAPKITGSEEDVAIFVNSLPGYNVSSWERNKDDTDWEHYQTCVCMSLAGDLRDRQSPQTEEEFKRFFEFIKDKFMIYYGSVSIYDEFTGKIKHYSINWEGNDLYEKN